MPMSEENRRKARERMKARHATSEGRVTKPQHINKANAEPVLQEPAMEPRGNSLEEDVADLTRRLNELLANQPQQRAKIATEAAAEGKEAPRFSPQGDMIGSFEKYIIDSSHYPDPCAALAEEPRLARFAFSENYELDFAVSTTSYTTIDNVRTREPKFTIKLIRIILDEDTGEATDKRYVVCTGIFHEDPEAAIEIARRNNIEVDTTDQEQFLNQMRYLRMRDWLLEAFYPPKPDNASQRTETVIGNRLVEVFTKSNVVGEQSDPIPFSQLKKMKA